MSGERGSGTVTSIAMIALMMVFLVVIGGLITVASANQRALAAADLAALAAADTARGLTTGEPCTVAASIAAANRATLVGCAQPGGRAGTVDVRVTVDIPGAYAWVGPAAGIARAGPPPGKK
ncbi:Rv3654c family TadE-like protein [Rothia sp. ZJ1223]|uniref:Rv3654c family TadE-like protein n=1 Tax=Rothia sp. ZJ1223 TaxID=2811098 RepID=UPI00195E285B|nr:Rv3654c family TadE-like protein [Rothia sp. ZJ1223]MBM7051965.1 hypothetical protein [Rothia sp. ZJ1223]